MKDAICKAFCNDIRVREVPAGLAVSTALRRSDGDAIGFYVVKSAHEIGFSHLEDDGTTIPFLEASGVDFDTQTRQRALDDLLREHGAHYDETEATIKSANMKDGDIASAALNFAALLLRLSDFLLLTEEHTKSAFRDDVRKLIRDEIGARATIEEDTVVNNLSDVKADLLIKAHGRDAVAVFVAQSAQKVNDAIFLQMATQYETHQNIAVVAILESDHSINATLRQRAANRLAAVPVFKNDEGQAIRRIVREALGPQGALH